MRSNIGMSSHTTEKQLVFGKLLTMHTHIVSGINKRHGLGGADINYEYIDLNCGSPDVASLYGTSAEIALRACLRAGLRPKMTVFDAVQSNVDETYSRLREMSAPESANIRAITADNSTFYTFVDLSTNAYGLCYADPNGVPPWGALRELSEFQGANKIDVVIHLNATAIKRARGVRDASFIKNADVATLPHLGMRAIKKEFWLIRRPSHRWQWSFLIGTNWDAFPVLKRLDFVSTRSDEGQEVLAKLSLTRAEIIKNFAPRKAQSILSQKSETAQLELFT